MSVLLFWLHSQSQLAKGSSFSTFEGIQTRARGRNGSVYSDGAQRLGSLRRLEPAAGLLLRPDWNGTTTAPDQGV